MKLQLLAFLFHTPDLCKLVLFCLALLPAQPMMAQLELLYEHDAMPGNFLHLKEDYQGNVLTCGVVGSDLTLGNLTLSVSDGGDFIAKYNPGSSTWLWANQTTGNLWIEDLTTDATGNTFITGYYYGVVTFDNITLTGTKYKQGSVWYDSWDIFVAKADANGNFLWAKTFGSNVGDDRGNGICTDASGNCYITGSYWSKGGQFSNCTKSDLYVVKLNSSGGTVWQKRFTPGACGGWGSGFDILLHSSGSIYITGAYSGTIPFGTGMTLSNGVHDVFTLKLNSSGTAQWVTTATGPGIDRGKELYTDAAGDVYVGGEYSVHELDHDPITFGSITLPASEGTSDAFLVKYSANGALSWLLHACTFTSYGEVTGLIPYEGNIMISLNNLGLKTIDPVDGGELDYLPLVNNLVDVPNFLYRSALRDLEPSASGFLTFQSQRCDTVGFANLTFAHSTCMGCSDIWNCPSDYNIIRSTGTQQLTVPPASISDNNALSFDSDTGFEVYPNPAKDEIKIVHPVALTPGQLIMYDQLGNTLLTHEIAMGQRFTDLSLDTKRFVEGIYYVSGILNGEMYTKKIIVGDR